MGDSASRIHRKPGVQKSCRQVKQRGKEVRNRIGCILAEKDLSESELARRTGIAQSYLNRIKNSRINPTVSTALKICRALEVRIEDAFLGDE